MTHQTALSLIQEALPTKSAVWADLGAGSGLFAEVLADHLPQNSTVIAMDKSPHMLWRLETPPGIHFQVMEGDFTREMEFPQLDGILMANALHYVEDPAAVLPHILSHLRPGGSFVLIEYETQQALPPWIPYPIPKARFEALASQAGLSKPRLIGTAPSQYGHDHIYALLCHNLS